MRFLTALVGGACVALLSCAAPQKQAPPVGGGIKSFDCTTDDEMKRGQSLRAWRSGGPEGATWNWYGTDLLCTVVVHGACDGEAGVVLELGKAPAARGTIALAQRNPTTLELRVPATIWERALESPAEAVYQTLALVVRVDGRCLAGAHASSDRHWSDSFVGGFSGGE